MTQPHKPTLRAERIVLVDYASTQAWAKGLAPSTSTEGSQVGATAAEPLNASSPPTANRVDMMYHQLAEIHAIAASQLAECAHWC
jgi:hypothetical protein